MKDKCEICSDDEWTDIDQFECIYDDYNENNEWYNRIYYCPQCGSFWHEEEKINGNDGWLYIIEDKEQLDFAMDCLKKCQLEDGHRN